MLKSLLVALPLLVGGGIAHAEITTRQLTDDSARVAYHAELATAAARDVFDAQSATSVTKHRWDHAVQKGHPRKAGELAAKHFQQLQVVRQAEWRLAREEYARDMAEKAFDADRVALRQNRTRDRG